MMTPENSESLMRVMVDPRCYLNSTHISIPPSHPTPIVTTTIDIDIDIITLKD
jgi:hypothetical protein